MEPEEFSSEAPGQLVQVAGGYAFVPQQLPVDIPVNRTLLIASDAARGALSEFAGLARLIQNLDLILAPLSRQEAVLSSRIEGTQTEVRDVLVYEAAKGNGGATLPPDSTEPDRDLREVLNYMAALQQGSAWVTEGRPLNLTLVRGLHAGLMQGVRGGDRHPGMFRAAQVYIGNRAGGLSRAQFVPAPPEQVSPLMDNLVGFATGETAYGPLIDCALLHYQFECIHPFENGNGRIGRLIIPLFLQTRGVIDRPILYMSRYLEAYRDDYVRLLKSVSASGNWQDWLLFFLEGVRTQANDSKRRVERIMQLQSQYRTLATAESSSRAIIPAIEFVMEHVYVTVSQIAQHTRTSLPTARATIEALAAVGILVPYGKLRGAQAWVANELLEEVYER